MSERQAMFRSVLLIAFILAYLLYPGVSMGGDDTLPGKWWRVPGLSERLNLTETQKDHLDELFSENRQRLSTLKEKIQRERGELDRLMEKEPFNEAQTMEQLRRVESARSDLAIERFRFLVEVRKLLGVERFKRLQSSFAENRERRPRHPSRGFGVFQLGPLYFHFGPGN